MDWDRPARPELLAPAGEWQALRAAVANGADAVYFGLSCFNARHRAQNFAVEELPAIYDFLHRHQVRGFVTLNTLIFAEELPAVVELIKAIAQAGGDAVIVQDLGLAYLLAQQVPELPVHASTQMTLTEPRGIAWVREQLNIRRVVLARELALPEISRILQATPMPVEVFIHGALCVAYSGQCLTSEALGGRSANRGQCAQACRLPYEMRVDDQPYDLSDRAYLLSPQDLAGYDWVGPLVEAGVASFKIEGRLKSPHYVAATTQTYRAALDAALTATPFQLDGQQQHDLAQMFSRGFTPGFLGGVNHQQLVQGRFPKSRGVCIGTVWRTTRRGVLVRWADAATNERLVKPGDGVVFDEGNPEQAEQGGRVWEVQWQGDRVELIFAPGSLDRTRIQPGQIVWKTDDPALRKRLEASYRHDRPVHRHPIDFHLSGQRGGSLTLTGRLATGSTAEAIWPGPLEMARKQPLTLEAIRTQLDRLGETPFALGDVTMALPDGMMLPKSVLNDLRRQVVDGLQRNHRPPTHPIAQPNTLATIRASIAEQSATEPEPPTLSHLHVLVRTMEQLDAVLAWQPPSGLPRPTLVWCDFEDTRRYRDAVPKARSAGLPVGLATLRILKPGEEGLLRPILHTQPDAVLVRNLGSRVLLGEQAPALTLVADFSFNIANEITAAILKRDGFAQLVPSYDLNWEQFVQLIRNSHPSWFVPTIHQHMPMFHMEHCVFAAFLSTGKDYRDCGRPCEKHQVELRDRVGASFPVLPDTGCRNTVFNAVAQSAAEYVGRMQALGLRHFRVELLRETPAQVGPLLERYSRILAGQADGRTTWRELQALNQLGVTRGTLQLL